VITNVISDESGPIEVAPGRGDLRYSSSPFFDLRRSIDLIGGQVSFAQLFATQPMVASVVGWLLRQSRRVPLKAYRRTGDDSRERLKPADHPLARGIVNPWEGGSQVDLTEALLGPFLVHGNALADVDQGAFNRIRFKPADWRFALPVMLWSGAPISGWEIERNDPSGPRNRPVESVLHVRAWSPLGPIGISPLQQLGVTIAIEDAAKRHQRAMLRNGARPPSAITASSEFLGLAPQERAALEATLREEIDRLYTGPENSGRPALLSPGLKWEQVGHTAVEAELIAQRVVNRTESQSVYGLPPAPLGVIERGAELAEQRQMAYTDGLAPPLILIEAVINAQLVAGLLKEEDVYVEFDFAGILRGDKLKEIESLRESISYSLMTPNEGRSILNMPQSDADGMDDFYLPRNNLWPQGQPYKPTGTPASTSSDGAGAKHLKHLVGSNGHER